ncbi:CBS domain-containing protein [Streptomyces aurantiacus]|uniref:Zinc metalloprotease n=1 Tax=Streptomyces aurantiacus JA 4570 TaxID=1286094 RepID=S4AK09_9ACTN|nr:CBS domain-containing protein [Streptomyces aurantiacus]EPH41822.1 putative zinc metalloprotease [Streptomyces aurantiacus JA 4570]
MTKTFALGRPAGIRVAVHWTVPVAFVLVASALAEARLPAAQPGRPTWHYWAAGLAAAVVCCASLAARDGARAVVARRHGVAADSIVLWPFGGAARPPDTAASPGAELRIAGAGPLVSLGLALGSVVLASLLSAVGASGLAVETVTWWAAVNALLAVGHALPGVPLDGARLLHAVAWWRTKDRSRATAVTAAVGRHVGWPLVLLGLARVVFAADLGGLWLTLLGTFLVTAATVGGTPAWSSEAPHDIPVRQAMSADPVTAPAALSVSEFLNGPHSAFRHSALPVVDDDGTPLGLISMPSLQRVAVPARTSTTLAEVSLPLDRVPTAAPDDPLGGLLPRLDTCPAHRALVVEGGRVVGVVTPWDVGRAVAGRLARH